MNRTSERFSPIARALHWLMAMLILAMLLLGAGMIAGAPAHYSRFEMWHKSVGVAIFVLAIIRLLYRLRHPAPPLPADLSAPQRYAAIGSQIALYALMIGLPLIGWAMLSAGGYPVTVFSGVQLPAIVPPQAALYAALRQLHAVLAWSLFGVFVLHLGAALYHGLIRRDGVLGAMASLRR